MSGELSLSQRGKNFQVEGKVTDRRGTYSIKGTLFGTTWNFKGTYSTKDAKGKVTEKPVNGMWDHTANALHIIVPLGSLVFVNEKNKPQGEAPNFTGTWETDFGKMTLTQSGAKVSGSYDYYGGKIDGEIRADGKLYFEWSQTNNKHGKGVFELATGGGSFSGWWDYTLSNGQPANNGGGWKGKRIT